METDLKVTPVPQGGAVPGHSQGHNWRAILFREIKLHPRGKAGVAERLGVSRTLVSLAAADKYHGCLDNFIRRVLDLESDIDCPTTATRRPRAECRKANEPAPTHNPLAMRIWRECQRCPLKPLEGKA